ncbi:ATP-binding protein, partial [Burkholderia vietnamiensis]|uniref:ATP-binding protein n=1 Tax=Burkholderia vietnamiensis TaxID=60552 RepID=UPI001FC89FB6
GIEAVQRHGKRVRYFSTVELTNALEQEKSIGKQGQIAHKLMYVDLVILDLCVARGYVERLCSKANRPGLSPPRLHITGQSLRSQPTRSAP